MQADPQYLRRHYASLCDDEFYAIDREDLVDVAQQCYDEESARRGLAHDPGDRTPERAPDDPADSVCACSFSAFPGEYSAPKAEMARDVLEAAGIPCELTYDPIDPDAVPVRYEYNLKVPGRFILRAMSVLDLEIFNQEVEEEWRTHFSVLSDGDLFGVSPDVLCAGMADRIERLTKAYKDETNRRKTTALEE